MHNSGVHIRAILPAACKTWRKSVINLIKNFDKQMVTLKLLHANTRSPLKQIAT